MTRVQALLEEAVRRRLPLSCWLWWSFIRFGRMTPPTLQTLLAAAANTSSDLLDLKIVVWDNTPGGQDNGELTRGILYKSAPHNPGLAQAHNQALKWLKQRATNGF